MEAGLSPAAATGAWWSAIDWSRPWLEPWRDGGRPVVQAVAAGHPLPQALNQPALAPVRFIPQAELPEGVAYESHIFATGGVPTREGLHDFFNALCWMRFPRTKRLLNRWQAEAIVQAGGVHATRGPLRDALTLFDENVALLHAPPALWAALQARDWPRVFVTLRPLWAQAQLVLFGHALTEKLVQPYKSITAHVLCLPMPPAAPGCGGPTAGPVHPWDAWLSEHLRPDWLAGKPFTPLPVLGVPGWWPANQDALFYDDPHVFRPARRPLVEA